MTEKARILIAGGGIGGCALAIALRQRGLDARVFEKQPQFTEVGAGLSLMPNATRVLRKLGMSQELDEFRPGSFLNGVFNHHGRCLSQSPDSALEQRFGDPMIVVHRAELLASLVRRVDDAESLHPDRSCVGFAQDASGVTLHTADGREHRGAVLIGADGIHSAVRRQLGRPSDPRYAGYVAWRAICDLGTTGLDTQGDWLGMYMGAGIQAGMYPINKNRLYWFLAKNAPPNTTAGSQGERAELLGLIEGWPEPLRRVIECTPESAILRNDINDLPPHATWGEGRVSLLGDAAHATTPNMGQGACMALEDALVLAQCLARDAEDPARALRAYEARRVKRTLKIVRNSRQLGRLFQLENSIGGWFRDRLFSMVKPESQLEQLSWLLEDNLNVDDLPV